MTSRMIWSTVFISFAVRVAVTSICDNVTCAPEFNSPRGQCMESGDSYYCNCYGGYSGDNCQYQVDYCASEPCWNGGSCCSPCYDGHRGYECTCQVGYGGWNCEETYYPCSITPRSEWTNRSTPSGVPTLTGLPVLNVVIHHTMTAPCWTSAICRRRIRAIEAYQMKYYKVPCTIYNLLIGENGEMYEGCGLDRALRYAGTDNAQGPSISVGFIGTFTRRSPNALARLALEQLFSSSCLTKLNIGMDYKMYTHYDLSCTACPGPVLRHWLVKKFLPRWGGSLVWCGEKRTYRRPMK